MDKFLLYHTSLSKVIDVVKNDVVKKDEYEAKIEDIEDKTPSIVNLAIKAAHSIKINGVKNEIRSITYLATNVSLNGIINEVRGEIPAIINLARTNTLTVVEKRISNVSGLVKKSDYDAEIKDIKDKYFTTSGYNKFAKNILHATKHQKS